MFEWKVAEHLHLNLWRCANSILAVREAHPDLRAIFEPLIDRGGRLANLNPSGSHRGISEEQERSGEQPFVVFLTTHALRDP